MKIQVIDEQFSICKVQDYSLVNLDSLYCFIGKTDEENSLVCLESDVPSNTVIKNDGWRAFRIEGTLDFSLVGILAKLTDILATENIGVFAISTYNTDYLLTKSFDFEKSITTFISAGYHISQ